MKKIAFLDRDGVINKKAPEHQYICAVGDFVFNPGIFKLLIDLRDRGYEFIIVTNQRGIARGHLDEATLHEIHAHMVKHLLKEGITILDIFYCPHGEGVCNCRKPQPGLLEKAVQKYDIDLPSSLMVSDSWKDVEMAKKFGIAETLFVESDTLSPYEKQN